MRASVYIGTSIDGFIARLNDDVDWLDSAGSSDATSDATSDASGDKDPREDYGYDAFIKTVDVLIMGRRTYEKVLTFGSWPFEKLVVVLTSRPIEIPPERAGALEAMSGEPHDILDRLAARGLQHAYVDGGDTIRRFLSARAIQRIIITRVPVMIGSGIPLVGPESHDVPLAHVRTRQYPNGLVQSEYTVR